MRLNSWNADFYNALQNKNVHDFPHLLLIFTGLAFALHPARGVRALSASDARVPLAAMAHEPVSGAMARRQRVLPNRARPSRRQPRPAYQRRPAVLRHHHAFAVARPAFDARHARHLHHDSLDHRGRAHVLARRHADHDSGLHGVGRRALRDSRLADHPEGRASARVDQLSAAESGSGFSLRADSRARKRRADRVLRRHLHRDRQRQDASSSAFATTGGSS